MVGAAAKERGRDHETTSRTSRAAWQRTGGETMTEMLWLATRARPDPLLPPLLVMRDVLEKFLGWTATWSEASGASKRAASVLLTPALKDACNVAKI